MASHPRARLSRALAFAAVTVLAPWVVMILPNFARVPELFDPAFAWLPALGMVLGIAAVAWRVQARPRAVPTILAALLAAAAMLVACGLQAVSVALSPTDPRSVRSLVSALASTLVLSPAWVAAARAASPLLEPRGVVRRPRTGAGIILFSGVAAISLGIWIASGTAVSGVEPVVSWVGLTFALAWGTLGISLIAMGRPSRAGARTSRAFGTVSAAR